MGDPLSGCSSKTDSFIHVEAKTREKEKPWGRGCSLPVGAKVNMGVSLICANLKRLPESPRCIPFGKIALIAVVTSVSMACFADRWWE